MDNFTEIFTLSMSSIALAMLFLTIFDNSKNKSIKAKEKFLNIIKENIENGIILDLSTIRHIKQSIEREFLTEIIVSNTLQDILTSFNQPQQTEDLSKITDLNENIKKLIDEENKIAPFENLPEEERRLLHGLEDAIKNTDTTSIQFYFDELNTVLSVRHVEHAKSIKMNKLAVPLAIIGLVLTIVFGLIGLQGTSKIELKNTIKETIQNELNITK